MTDNKTKGDYYGTLLKYSQDFVTVFDKDARIQYLSPAYEKKFSRTVKERLNKSAYEYVHPDDVPNMKNGLKLAMDTTEATTFEVRLKDAYGNWVCMAAHAYSLLGQTPINGIIVNFWDITKRKEYERELKKANETKNKLFSIIGHDLTGHTAANKMVCDYILENAASTTKEEIMVLLGRVQQSNESLSGLVKNLLTWSKSQLERIVYKPGRHELLPLIKETIGVYQHRLDAKSLKVEITGGKDKLAWFDPEQVNIVIRNLFSNAIKYSHSNGAITIEITSSKGSIQCALRDYGTGMEKQVMDSLFQNSFPKSTPGTNNEKGSGLGLMFCKEFVERNNGEIWVESETGKGSTFYFTLPYQ